MRRSGTVAALVVTGLSLGCVCPPRVPTTTTTNEPRRVVIVKGKFSTAADNGPQGQGINIDGAGGAALSFGKIKRYTLTLWTSQLATAPAGVDRIEVFVGVLAGNTASDVRVIRQDPATASPLPHPGMTVPPYAGTNSHINVVRGADGLGPVEIRFNAYVEVEP